MSKARAPKKRIVLPDDPTSLELGDVDRWLNDNDDRPIVERIAALWDHAGVEEHEQIRGWAKQRRSPP